MKSYLNRTAPQPVKNYIEFRPRERWVHIKEELGGCHYISNEGRVMRMTETGVFVEMKQIISRGTSRNAYVINTKPHLVNTATMVLKYFSTGYRPRRRIAYKNGNRKDCRLLNLEWLQGFNEGIDYEYLEKIKNAFMSNNDKIALDYLITKDYSLIHDFVEEMEQKIQRSLHKLKLDYKYVKDNKASIALEVCDSMDKGNFIPRTNRFRGCRTKKNQVYFTSFVLNTAINLVAKEKKCLLNQLESVDNDLFLDFFSNEY